MKIAHELLHALDSEFTRLDVKQEVVDRGYTIQYTQHILEYLLLSGLIDRTARGEYQKAGE